jgi:hypothetical protein
VRPDAMQHASHVGAGNDDQYDIRFCDRQSKIA